LEDLQGASLRVDYSHPGEFQWGHPNTFFSPYRWVVIVEPGREGRWLPRPSLRARTREEVLQALLRLDATFRDNAARGLRGLPPAGPAPPVPPETQIPPTDLSLTVIYLPSASNRFPIRIVSSRGADTWQTLF